MSVFVKADIAAHTWKTVSFFSKK